MDFTHVLYHKACPDGFASAYVAWTILGDNVRYIPVSYYDKVPNIKNGRILVCDFSLIGIDSTMPFKVNVSFMPRLSSKVFYFDMFKSFLLFCLYGPRLCEPRSCQTESTLFLILHLKPLIAINQSFQEKNIHPQRKKFRMLYLNWIIRLIARVPRFFFAVRESTSFRALGADFFS